MHCLPALKDNEAAFEVIENPVSKVWDEAENRKHTIKAVMPAAI
jgi:ornithine carbamoyltransferase